VKPAGLIFAAGESRRMGRDKALLDYRGSTFLNHLISLFAPRAEPVIVVLGHNAETIRQTIASGNAPVRIVLNPGYARGMLSSFQAGIRALPPEAAAALFTLVDHPAVEPATLDALLAAYASSGLPLAIPRCGDRRGHPVIAARPILEEMLALPDDASPKQVIHAHRSETFFLDVADPGVLRDIDRPEEYEEWRKSW
jgi:molybdenum cofactor cytidylyltransferase